MRMFGRPVETFQGALFLKASSGETVADMFLLAPFNFVGQDEFEELGVIEFLVPGVSHTIRQDGEHAG
jgi:hypothetical protein